MIPPGILRYFYSNKYNTFHDPKQNNIIVDTGSSWKKINYLSESKLL